MKCLVHVVNDYPVIAWTVATILKSHGFEAAFFTDPLESLQAAAIASPHLLISDITMPQLNGVELAIRIKELCPDCKVLLFSSEPPTHGYLIEALKQGHTFEILIKPVQPADLLDRVESLTHEAGCLHTGV